MTTIGDDSLPKGIRYKQVHWKDDSDRMYSHILTDVLFFTNSSVKIISITKLAHEMNDENGTWIRTMGNKSNFCWNHEKTKRTIYHPPSNLPKLILCESYHDFQSYCTLTNKSQHRKPHSIPTYANTMPELESRDINPTLPVPADTSNGTYVFNEKEKVVYNLNGTDIKVIIISRTCDNDTSTLFYRIQFENGHFATSTTEFFSALTDTDIARPYITSNEILAHANRLTQKYSTINKS